MVRVLLSISHIMSFKLKPDEATDDGLKRVAIEQIDKALATLKQSPRHPDKSIHDARVCLKKIRAVLRLAEFELGDKAFDRENKSYRDAGRLLSSVRDSAAMVETLDKLADRFKDQLETDAFSDLRRPLLRTKSNKKSEKTKALANAQTLISVARRRVERWPIRHNGFSVVRGGFLNIYNLGRQAFSKAYEQPTVKNFHEWRKEVKSLRYEIEILRSAWPDVMDEMSDEIDRLGDYLSDLHDLAILREKVLEQSTSLDESIDLEALVALIDQRSEELRIIAKPLGKRVYAEKPNAFVRRQETYWRAMKKEASINPIAEG